MNNKRIARELVKLAKSLIAMPEPINFEYFDVNKNKIYVSSSSTTYADYVRKDYLDAKIKDVVDKLKRLKIEASKKKIKLKNYKTRMWELSALENEYNSEIKKYNKLFDELYRLWKKIEKKKDLFYAPTFDLEKRIPEYGRAVKIGDMMSRMFYHSEVLSKVDEIDFRLDRLLRSIKNTGDEKFLEITL